MILLVDDYPMMTEIMAGAIEKWGYQVTSASDSKEALKKFKENPDAYTAILTDYNLPFLNGMDLGREILSIRNDIPMILISGIDDEDLKNRAKEVGFEDFMLKPLCMDRLNETLMELKS